MKRHPIWIILFTILIDTLGIGILSPILPQLLGNPNSPHYLLRSGQSVQDGYILFGFLVAIYPVMQFFATPILYKLTAIAASPLYRFVKYNPMVYPLDLLRSPILDGRVASLTSFGLAAAFAAILFVGAAFTLGGLQKKLIFYL